jgi:broad specificity phosphatase PhoE
MRLDERLAAVCLNGSLLQISLDRNRDGLWRASYRNASNTKVVVVEHKDPIQALFEAITPIRQPSLKSNRNDDIL